MGKDSHTTNIRRAAPTAVLTPIATFCKPERRKPQMSVPTLNHVFSLNVPLLIPLLSVILFLIRPGTGLHPPQCQWDLYQDIERLKCRVEPGRNNLIVEEEVNSIGPEHAKSLWVYCSDSYNVPPELQGRTAGDEVLQVDSYFGSEKTSLKVSGDSGGSGFVLSHGVFMAVSNLRDLRLENCRIAGITPGALSYLPYLVNLTIHAQTSLSPLSSSLDIKDLRGIPELRHLDLSSTSLNSLDFCSLSHLNHLNMSQCGLRDFRSVGIAPLDPTKPHKCGSHLKVLDLSGNHFTLLPPAIFTSSSNLEELMIQQNSITSASERALLGLHHLKIFDASQNSIRSLQPEFFKDTRLIESINLSYNKLEVLAPTLFHGLNNLGLLDLSFNQLTSEWVQGETFKSLFRLIVINLSNNLLTRIDSVLLKDLTALQVLNLEYNKISSIADDAFSGMTNLHTLLLSHNQIATVDTFMCNGLYVLSYLSLDWNKIESVGPESFRNCSGVTDLNLSGNNLKTVPEAIGSLSLLRTLDLGENKIVSIGNASYQSLPNLYGLRLTDNLIHQVPKDAFANMLSIKIINIAKNKINSIEPGAFDKTPTLQAIRLDSNKLTEITDLFKNVPNLLWLNISANELRELKYQEFPPKLQWLDLRSNKISTVGNCLEIDNLRIRNLDISHNLISEIGSSNLPDSIENLIMNHNSIHQVHPYTFFRKPNLTRIDLSHNQLVRLDQNALRLSPNNRINNNNGQEGMIIPELLLGSNPLQCDCTMQWLQGLQGEAISGQYPIIQDVEEVKCTLSFERGNEPVSLMSIPPSNFLCKYENHCLPSCECCLLGVDNFHCDCYYNCPNDCTCFRDENWSTNIVTCSSAEVQDIPARIPIDANELYLDGNNVPELPSHAFLGRKKLQSLYLNGSHVEVIQNRTFHGLKALRVLHLEINFIERLEGFEFEDLDSLEELYLHQNAISFISNVTFLHLTRLTTLTLHDNMIKDLPIWQVLPFGRLREITLRGNEFSCVCDFETKLRHWLIDNRARVIDSSQVQCVDSQVPGLVPVQAPGGGNKNPTRTELIVVRILEERNHRCFHNQTTELISIREPAMSGDQGDFVPLILCIVLTLVLIFVILILSYYWRKPLKVWLYANCGLRLEGSCREPHAERDKLFDAFVSYSSKDEAWVRQVFAAELERNDPPYRLCLRYRDLPTGGTYLADTIVQAAEASRRTILVLSHHFLKGEWSRTDVKSAHHSVLKDRHRKVIIILLGDLPSKDLDPDIRLYLKNHTYLNCEEKNFWDKLKYALPEVRVKAPLFRNTNGRNSTHAHGNHQNHNGQNHHQQGQNHLNRAMPPPPPPHYQYPLPPPPSHPSPSLTNHTLLSHHHLLSSVNNVNSASNSANNTLHHPHSQHQHHQHNMLNALNSVILPNGMNLGGMNGLSHHHQMPPNIVPLAANGVGPGSGSGSLRSSQQRQYHTIVNATLNQGGHHNSSHNNRHAVHI